MAYIVPHAVEASEWERQQVARWNAIHEETYAASRSVDPTFDIVGWNGSATGQPIPEEEMREQLDRAVEWILRLRPERVLEIGCGTGLLLFRMASHCVDDVGTDFSAVALDCVRRMPLAQAHLIQAEVDYSMPSGLFETVILNLVVQYFPSIEYLIPMRENAARNIVDEGHIFICDVRSLPLLDVFHTWVEQHGGARRRREVELVINPEFFESVRPHCTVGSAAQERPFSK